LSDHPSREELWAVWQGGLAPRRHREILLHLLAPCRRCLEEAHGVPDPIAGLTLRRPDVTPEQEAAYDGAIARAFGAALRHASHVRRQEEQARKALALLETGGLEAVEKLPRKLGDLARMKAFLARSWQLRHDDPGAMVELAWFAAQVSRTLDPRRYGPALLCDFQALAFAGLGNAYRVADRLQEAAQELGRARQCFELGTRDEALEVRLLELEASLAADRRQFGRAASDLAKVLRYHERRRDLHLAGRTLVLMGLYAGYAGDFEKGIEQLERGLAQVDAGRDPGLACAAAHNLILFLVDSGRFPEAKRLRLVHSRHLVNPGGRVNEIKFRALEGRLDLGLGNYPRAEAVFREVRDGFEAVGRSYVAAIAALDLAAALLAQRKEGEAKLVALEALETFTRLEIQREALAAVILLRNAFEMGEATRTMVEEVARFLRWVEIDPALRFVGQAWEEPGR
jgi:hypothetical protein